MKLRVANNLAGLSRNSVGAINPLAGPARVIIADPIFDGHISQGLAQCAAPAVIYLIGQILAEQAANRTDILDASNNARLCYLRQPTDLDRATVRLISGINFVPAF